MSLYDLTRDLHHKAEAHPWGAAMAAGVVSSEGWADWLGALLVIHRALDPHLDPSLRRVEALEADLAALDVAPRACPAAEGMAAQIDPETARGVGYILAGAHLRGGAVIRRRMPWPCSHLTFEDARSADVAVRELREDVSAAEAAQWCFETLIEIMGEVRR